ncbi:hypothetical protein BDR07DRAFT_884951 [Suillus spraguei]|nr:hypothetical protein BDR07DRAFT_884951 [Suillus spraguei]
MSRYSSTTPSRILNVTRQTKVSNTNGYYPRCRDVDGTSVMIAQTATDLGAHTRWIYPEHDTNDNEEETGVDVDEGHTTSPSSTMTCLTQHAFDAALSFCTSVKEALAALAQPRAHRLQRDRFLA